jgi:uncharacterized protein YqjF (DUF2071 family)
MVTARSLATALSLSDFPKGIVGNVAHRPWPMPNSPWLMTQSWHDLLFAHWPVDRELLRSKVPQGLELDLYEGEAWISVVPFRMTNVAPRGLPVIPGLSDFAEVNVRTYVTIGGKPGIYFFSLDADSTVAVATARSLLRLPYYKAEIDFSEEGEEIAYASLRTAAPAAAAELAVRYRPVGPSSAPIPGTLEHFLTERYCLYNVADGFRAYRLDIHHLPWRLQRAEASFRRNTMLKPTGLRVAATAPALHFSRRQDMVAWAPVSLDLVPNR